MEATAFLRYLFLSGPDREKSILREQAFPLTHTAGNEAHVQRLLEVMEYIPCGFPRPPPTSVDSTLLFYVILGAAALSMLVCCCLGVNHHYHRMKRLKLNPLYGINIQKVLENLLEEFKDEKSGAVATYIPQLAVVDPDLFGIAIMTCEGKLYSAGNCHSLFSIQSMSKPFLYAQAVETNGFDMMHAKIGVEPSGDAFNSEKMDKDGKPFNPYINSGAITCVGLLPFGETTTRFETIREFMSSLSYSGDLTMCNDTYQSESSTADQNRLIGKVLLENDILSTSFDVEHGLEAYFMACSTLVSAVECATMVGVLANHGKHPMRDEAIISSDVVDEVNSVMMTCGMYNGAGNWMIDVGIPAKSGVSGGIMAVVPNVCGLAVYSPRLNKHYNSVRGMLVCSELSIRLGLHLINKSAGTEREKNKPSFSQNSISKSKQSGSFLNRPGDVNRSWVSNEFPRRESGKSIMKQNQSFESL